jgi:hypothetical protein
MNFLVSSPPGGSTGDGSPSPGSGVFGSSLVVALVLALGLLCGCAGYRLGPTNGLAAGGKSIQVNLFQNQTLEPRLSEAVAAALRKDLQRDGTFTLNTEGDADLVVNGVLVQYGRLPLTYQRRDILSARDFRVTVTAKLTVLERGSGRVVLNREVNGATMVRIDPEQNALGIGSDQTSAERQALPLLATDLARRVTALLVDGEW